MLKESDNEKAKSKASKLIKSKGAVANIDIAEIDKTGDDSEKSDNDNKKKK